MKPDKTWLIANWKMNGTVREVQDYAHQINSALGAVPAHITVVYCPPVAFLTSAHQGLPKNTRLKLGAQNVHEKPKGAFTGETSAAMLAELGAQYVIVGHSERRACGESDKEVMGKAQSALEAGLIPVICVGESAEEYHEKRTTSVLDKQLAALQTLTPGSYLIAYEPIWAIGSGKTPSLVEINAAHSHIKTVLGSATHVLYGGSVNAENAKEILRLPEVSGALIGSASLNISSMRDIISAAQR